MGYRVFGIEAEFGGSQIVNDYILNVKWILDYENKCYGNDKIMLWAQK